MPLHDESACMQLQSHKPGTSAAETTGELPTQCWANMLTDEHQWTSFLSLHRLGPADACCCNLHRPSAATQHLQAVLLMYPEGADLNLVLPCRAMISSLWWLDSSPSALRSAKP